MLAAFVMHCLENSIERSFQDRRPMLPEVGTPRANLAVLFKFIHFATHSFVSLPVSHRLVSRLGPKRFVGLPCFEPLVALFALLTTLSIVGTTAQFIERPRNGAGGRGAYAWPSLMHELLQWALEDVVYRVVRARLPSRSAGVAITSCRLIRASLAVPYMTDLACGTPAAISPPRPGTKNPFSFFQRSSKLPLPHIPQRQLGLSPPSNTRNFILWVGGAAVLISFEELQAAVVRSLG